MHNVMSSCSFLRQKQRRHVKHLSAACMNTHVAYSILAFMHGLCLHLAFAAPQGDFDLSLLTASLKYSSCPF